jgi:hypothetical protein
MEQVVEADDDDDDGGSRGGATVSRGGVFGPWNDEERVTSVVQG